MVVRDDRLSNREIASMLTMHLQMVHRAIILCSARRDLCRLVAAECALLEKLHWLAGIASAEDQERGLLANGE